MFFGRPVPGESEKPGVPITHLKVPGTGWSTCLPENIFTSATVNLRPWEVVCVLWATLCASLIWWSPRPYREEGWRDRVTCPHISSWNMAEAGVKKPIWLTWFPQQPWSPNRMACRKCGFYWVQQTANCLREETSVEDWAINRWHWAAVVALGGVKLRLPTRFLLTHPVTCAPHTASTVIRGRRMVSLLPPGGQESPRSLLSLLWHHPSRGVGHLVTTWWV